MLIIYLLFKYIADSSISVIHILFHGFSSKYPTIETVRHQTLSQINTNVRTNGPDKGCKQFLP